MNKKRPIYISEVAFRIFVSFQQRSSIGWNGEVARPIIELYVRHVHLVLGAQVKCNRARLLIWLSVTEHQSQTQCYTITITQRYYVISQRY